MQENKTKARNNSLDIVKFIAALLVVGVHANFLNDISPTVAKVVNAALGRMAVPFFACVTGYFLTKHEKKDSRGWIKNIKSLLSYYVVFSVIYIIWGFTQHEFAGLSAGDFDIYDREAFCDVWNILSFMVFPLYDIRSCNFAFCYKMEM